MMDTLCLCPSGLRVKSGMMWYRAPRCGYCLKASMTVLGLSCFTRVTPRRPVDSRLRGKDGRFCKGLLDGRGIKEPVPVLDTGSEGEKDATHRHVIAARVASAADNASSICSCGTHPIWPMRNILPVSGP